MGAKHPLDQKRLNLIWVRVPDRATFDKVGSLIESSPYFADRPVKVESESSGISNWIDGYRTILDGMKFLLGPVILVIMALVTTFMATPLLSVFYPRRVVEQMVRDATGEEEGEEPERKRYTILVPIAKLKSGALVDTAIRLADGSDGGGRIILLRAVRLPEGAARGGPEVQESLSTDRQRFWKPAELLDLVPTGRGPAGEIFRYTDTNYLLLGLVIEHVRGRPIADVLRDGWTEAKDIVITREQIRLLPVQSQDLGNGIVHVKLRDLQPAASRDLVQLLARLEKDGMKGLILDLRNNPGGSVAAAVEVAEIFVDDGRLVTYTEGRVRAQERFSSRAKQGYRALPMAVLVNHGTSAGAEIVAGALQDWGRASLIGVRTFGRASIQTIVPLADGTALRLTTAEWFTPKGRSVREKGLTPDVVVAHEGPPATAGTAEEMLAHDRQLAAAFAHVRSVVGKR